MNRSILIVICDFLLVSLLVFSTVDINKVADDGPTKPVQINIATNRASPGSDLAAVMKLALDDEQKRRALLLSELEKTRATASERERELQLSHEQLQASKQRLQSSQQELEASEQRMQSSQQELQASEQRLQSFQQELQTSQQRLQASQQELQNSQQELQASEQKLQTTQQQQASLQQQFASAQSNLTTLSGQVRASSTDATITKEKLAAMEAELRQRAQEAAALEQRLTRLAQSNQMVLNEKQQLSTRLQVAEVEQRHATEQVVAMKEQVKVEREEKAKLVEGVKVLATNSTQLVQEIRENRPLTPNQIFEEFIANRVHASFDAFRAGLFDTNKRKQTGTVLVTDGTNTFALCHVEDTPLTLGTSGTQWDVLTGALTRNPVETAIRTLSFHLQDPRVVLVPVNPAEARRLAGKAYRISTTPFKFQEAVLIGATDDYYGECRFEIDVSTSAYVKLDRSVLRGWFGKFNPSRGDLVFSRTGEFLGIMVNNTYCLLIHNFEAMATLNLGPNVQAQDTGGTLATLGAVLQQLPTKLQ